MVDIRKQRFVLSAREELVLARHLVAVLELRAEVPDASDNESHDTANNGCVGPPVGRLGVPTTSRRPDVLRVAGGKTGQRGMAPGIGAGFLRNLSSAAHCELWLSGEWGSCGFVSSAQYWREVALRC